MLRVRLSIFLYRKLYILILKPVFMFNNVITVKGHLLSPFEGLKDRLPPCLDMTVDDLERLDALTKDRLKFKPRGECYVRSEEREDRNFFEELTSHGRSIHTGKSNIEKEADLPYEELVYVCKGSGLRGWNRKDFPLKMTDKKGRVRHLPISFRWTTLQDPRKFWGGMSDKSSVKQYHNALILNAISQRHKIEGAVCVPLQIARFSELPLIEDGKLRICTHEEYCNSEFTGSAIPHTVAEAKQFAEFVYVGEIVHLRVPPRTDKNDGNRIYSAGYLADSTKSADQRRNLVEKFAHKIGSLARAVHSYRGTFSFPSDYDIRQWIEKGSPDKSPNIISSSLNGSNVSLSGVVCDLESVNFEIDDDDLLAHVQRVDRIGCVATIQNFANLYDIPSRIRPDDPKMNYNLSWSDYPTLGLARAGIEALLEVYPDFPEKDVNWFKGH